MVRDEPKPHAESTPDSLKGLDLVLVTHGVGPYTLSDCLRKLIKDMDLDYSMGLILSYCELSIFNSQ